MTDIVGRTAGDGPTAALGSFRARDGSLGAPCRLDVNGPHAALVVGKRGYGKSYTLGVLAEELARARGVAPVVVDPMGVFAGLADGTDDVAAAVESSPAVAADAVPPRAWCAMLDLAPSSGPGALLWRAAADAETLSAMRRRVRDADASGPHRRAALNHLDLAAAWDVFDADGLPATDLATAGATVLDVSGRDAAAMNAVVRAVAAGLYDARVGNAVDRLPWLLVDEAHAFFDGVAAPALRRLLTRGHSRASASSRRRSAPARCPTWPSRRPTSSSRTG